MSDRFRDRGVSGGEPPMTPPPAPPVPGAVELASSAPVRAGSLGVRVAAGALGVALLLGGVAFAATQAGNHGGASDPEAAVTELFAAIAAEDVLGVLATLDPAERDAIAGPVEQLFDELERLDVLDGSFDLGGVAGVDLEFQDLDLDPRRIRDDLYRVHLAGGTASYAVDTDEIPVGEFLTDAFERLGVEYRGIQESDSEVLDPDGTGETFVVVRHTGDGWHVSLGYTAVEAARLDRGAPVPDAGSGLIPIGADSPEAAVEAFLQAVVAIDVEGALARVSPGELGAVHDYWPVLAGADVPTPEDVPADIQLSDLVLRPATDGDRGQVFVDGVGVDVVSEDFTGGGTFADGCVEVRGDVRTTLEDEGVDLPEGAICGDDIEQIIEDATGGFDRMGLLFGGFPGLDGLTTDDSEIPTLGISVVRIDGTDSTEGGWFVAPVGTVADLGLAVLESIEREDLEAMIESVEGFFGGFTGMLGGGFVPGMTEDLGGFEGFKDLEGFDGFGEVETSTGVFRELGERVDGE